MFRVIDFRHLIRYVAIATVFISIFAYEYARENFDNRLPITKVLSIAPWVVLIALFILTTHKTARIIWWCGNKIGMTKYPDLNGSWEGEITLEDGKKIQARASIRQTLLDAQIDLHTETAKSLNLETTPIIESGQNKIYYKYRSIPKEPSWNAYDGSTTFDIRMIDEQGKKHKELSGSYFTSRKSVGRVRLRQTSTKTSVDVSYY